MGMNLEKSFRPRKTRKAQKFSKNYQSVDGYPKGKLLIQYNVLVYFVSFVLFVDKLRFLRNRYPKTRATFGTKNTDVNLSNTLLD